MNQVHLIVITKKSFLFSLPFVFTFSFLFILFQISISIMLFEKLVLFVILTLIFVKVNNRGTLNEIKILYVIVIIYNTDFLFFLVKLYYDPNYLKLKVKNRLFFKIF